MNASTCVHSVTGRKKSHVSHIRMVRSCSEASNISTDSSAPKIKDCRLSESRNNCAAIAQPRAGGVSPCSSDDECDFDSEDLPPPKLYTMAATAPSPTRRSVRLTERIHFQRLHESLFLATSG